MSTRNANSSKGVSDQDAAMENFSKNTSMGRSTENFAGEDQDVASQVQSFNPEGSNKSEDHNDD
ncbi:hypothetical protein A0256_01505 [Mucilaginibacter sp. PAMC 26640]|nr:hypothetical protein A0256_01505 [Mucilaginibacter sp. PAMC 26640]